MTPREAKEADRLAREAKEASTLTPEERVAALEDLLIGAKVLTRKQVRDQHNATTAAKTARLNTRRAARAARAARRQQP